MPPTDPTGQPKPAAAPPARPAAPAPPTTPIPPMETLRLAQFLRAAAHNPETRAQVAEIALKIDPNGVGKAFTDVGLERRFNALEKKLADRDLEKQIKDAVAVQQAEKTALKKERGFSDEQIADIEKTMQAKGIYSYRDGAILYEADHPPPPEEAPAGGSAMWEFPTVMTRDGKGQVPFKDFQKDPKSAAYNAAYRVIDDFKFNKLPPAFHRAA